jgi:hypothetical protein
VCDASLGASLGRVCLALFGLICVAIGELGRAGFGEVYVVGFFDVRAAQREVLERLAPNCCECVEAQALNETCYETLKKTTTPLFLRARQGYASDKTAPSHKREK